MRSIMGRVSLPASPAHLSLISCLRHWLTLPGRTDYYAARLGLCTVLIYITITLESDCWLVSTEGSMQIKPIMLRISSENYNYTSRWVTSRLILNYIVIACTDVYRAIPNGRFFGSQQIMHMLWPSHHEINYRIKVRNIRTWSAVRLLVRKPIWDLWRIYILFHNN